MWVFFGEIMALFFSVDAVGDFLAGGALAIGNFDGVHRGHQQLLHHVLSIKGDGRGGVLSFSPHPSHFLHPERPFFYLSSPKQKAENILSTGCDAFILQPLSEEFLSLSPKQFFEEILLKKLKLKNIVVGDDFSFGKKAAGTIDDLRNFARGLMEITIVPTLFVDGIRCSSSAIREFLKDAELEKARAMLGRPFSLRGQVKADQKLGAALGFATANLRPENFFLKKGVYASITRLHREGSCEDFLSATNVGVRPTVSNEPRLTVETHCLDRMLDLDNADLEIFFIDYVREENKFPSLRALQEQVQKDFQAVRQKYRLHPHLFDVAN